MKTIALAVAAVAVMLFAPLCPASAGEDVSWSFAQRLDSLEKRVAKLEESTGVKTTTATSAVPVVKSPAASVFAPDGTVCTVNAFGQTVCRPAATGYVSYSSAPVVRYGSPVATYYAASGDGTCGCGCSGCTCGGTASYGFAGGSVTYVRTSGPVRDAVRAFFGR